MEIAKLAAKFINTTNRNVFLTGKAGTGKTTFLREIVQKTHKRTVITAPTGVAAINAGGVTLHSLFQLPFGIFLPEEGPSTTMHSGDYIHNQTTLLQNLKLNVTKRKLIREIELLIIDEVSMLRADLLDAIDTVMGSVRRKKHLPFGGAQVLFIGDLLQLPPVVKDEDLIHLKPYYESVFFFQAQCLQQEKPVYLELDKVYRQSDEQFVELLNRVRDNEMDEYDIRFLNKKFEPDFYPEPDDGYIFLTTHNRKAEAINKRGLQLLEAKTESYEAEINGDFNEHSYPLASSLTLKLGAQVMFIKNDPQGKGRFFNGKIGHIKALGQTIIVGFRDGDEVEVEKYAWENKKFKLNESTNEIEENVVGTFSHYPIKLAWAITIHKSQGLAFEKAILDIESAFAPGQVYVALSRLTSLDGLVLNSPIPDTFTNQFSTESAVQRFQDTNRSIDNSSILAGCAQEYLITQIKAAFDFDEISKAFYWHLESYQQESKQSTKSLSRSWASNLRSDFIPVTQVSQKFLNQITQISNQENSIERLRDRSQSALDYFIPIFNDLHANIKTHYGKVSLQKRVKAYLKEIEELSGQINKQIKHMKKVNHLFGLIIDGKEVEKNEFSELLSVNMTVDKSKATKEPKIPTHHITLELIQKGKDLAEIAEERTVTLGTIQSHVAKCIKEKKLDVHDFLESNSLLEITDAAKTLDTLNATPIKEKLNNKYDYNQIRYVTAYLSNMT